MEYFIIWIMLSLVVGFIGSSRSCGFAGGFFGSLILSPLIGIVIVLVSSSNQTKEFQKEIIDLQKKSMNASRKDSDEIYIELGRLQMQVDTGIITPEKYQELKVALLKPKVPVSEFKKPRLVIVPQTESFQGHEQMSTGLLVAIIIISIVVVSAIIFK